MQLFLGAIDPVALHLGPLEIRWYGLIIVTGILSAIWLSSREAARLGLDPDFVSELAVWAVPAGIIGARAYEVIVLQWAYYAANPSEIVAIWHGGLSIHGAVIGGTLGLAAFVYRRKAPVWRWMDIVVPGLALAQAIGRWGNFFNQEAYGRPAPNWVIDLLPGFMQEQMYILDPKYSRHMYMHPTFLYESIWNLIVVYLLTRLRLRNPLRGTLFLSYVVFYSIGRFLIEGLRMDSSYMFGGTVRIAQFVSALLILGALVLMWRRGLAVTERYEDP